MFDTDTTDLYIDVGPKLQELDGRRGVVPPGPREGWQEIHDKARLDNMRQTNLEGNPGTSVTNLSDHTLYILDEYEPKDLPKE
jgi:hypothetical protein